MISTPARVARVGRFIATAVSLGCHSLAHPLGKVWEAHRGQLMRNAAYAAAMAAAAADIVNQVDLDRLVAAVLFATVAIYVAIRYGQGTPSWRPDGPDWR
jgi:hypothetical protein